MRISYWSSDVCSSDLSLEAQVAAIADDIAYDHHDIDDGIRAGLLNLEQLLEVPFVRKSWNGVKARYPDLPDERLIPELIRDQIGSMVNDVIETTRGNIAEAGIETDEDFRAAGDRKSTRLNASY